MAATMLAGFLVTATGNWALPFYTAAAAIVVGALVMAVGVSARPLFLETNVPAREIGTLSGWRVKRPGKVRGSL